MNFKLVVVLVKGGGTDRVVDAAKAAGGTGATIVPARGTGIHEAKTFFGLTLEAQTDMVLFLLDEGLVDSVLEAVYKAGRFKEPGTGIAFVVDVERVTGLESQLGHFQKESERKKTP
jgi:nitrogen regulatory protein PII